MIIEAIFWFHPLMWWIRARLVEERELACDELVLAAGYDAKAYAEGILSVCRFYFESPSCVMGVGGANLKKRIERILVRPVAADLNPSKRVLLVCAGISSIALPFMNGMLNASPSQAQTPRTYPEFEVASIKPRKDASRLVRIQPYPGGRLVVENFSLRMLMMSAYGVESFNINGGPDWINSDRYDIEAKAEGSPSGKQMAGPMLRGLLENRFQVKLHGETRQLPVYELAMGRTDAKLQRSKEGGCTPFSLDSPPLPMPVPGERRPRFCGFLGFGVDGVNRTLDLLGVTMPEFARSLSRGDLRRTVIDRTGLTGIFDVHLKWTVDATARLPSSGEPDDQATPRPSPDTFGSSIFTAIHEQLGLNLRASKGPVEVLVIDHAEKPSPN